MKLGLVGRIVIAGAIVLVFLTVEFLLVIGAFRTVHSAVAGTDRATEAIALGTELEKLILDLETGQRGFAISGNPQFLEPWQAAQRQLPGVANRLLTVERRNPGEAPLARSIVRQLNAYERGWSNPIVRIAQRDPQRARALITSAAAKARTDRLRASITQLIAAERRSAADGHRRVAAAEHNGKLIGAAGIGVAALLFVAIVGYFLRWSIGPVRRLAAATDRVRAGDLSTRVPEFGAGEVGDLARGFNAMAESLERSRQELEGHYVDLSRLANVLRAVLDSTVDAILLSDLEGRIQLANRPMLRFVEELGIVPEGTAVERLLSIRDKVVDGDRYVATMQWLADHPEEPSFDEFELDDPQRVFQGFTAPVRGDDGELVGRIWTMREVTQERELDRLKDDFVATVSHELRTPLTSMMGFLEMLREGEGGGLSPEQDRFLSIVYRSSERLQRLVGDLLFVARLDASGLQLQLGDVRLDEVVAEAVQASAALARTREIEMVEELAPVPPLRGDRERLGQLVSNLLSNALKFTPPGGRVAARTFVQNGNAVVEIDDTGVGIPPAEQERLFERFFRASTATEQAVPGTGLGLVISKAIVEAHGGRITASSSAGNGTCFHVELPL